MPSIPLTFFFLAAVILLGFASARLFQVTRFPDIPVLLFLGLLIGPLNVMGVEHGIGSRFLAESLNVETLKDFAPFVSTLALVVILFDSGLKLDFSQFGKGMRPAFAHTLPLFFFTVTLIALIGHYLMGMPTLIAVCLGVALSNVGQTVSAAIIREARFSPSIRSIYFIEMAIYDLISIPILVALLDFASTGGGDPSAFVGSLSRVLIVSLFVGFVGGLVWMAVLVRLQENAYSYMVTLASLLLVYAINSFLGGSGPVSVLVFGLVLGNREALLKLTRKRSLSITEGERVQSFHDEITFFVRAFYFIFLGIVFSSGRSGGWGVHTDVPLLEEYNGTAFLFFFAAALVFLAILWARYLVVRFISSRGDPERMALFTVYGRGLGTAVLATFPFTTAKQTEAGADDALFLPWENSFVNLSLVIILLTVLGSGIALFLSERRDLATQATSKKAGTRRAAKD